MRGNPIRPVRYMNDDDKIDRLRHAKYMHIDKASENIAAQHCCSIHYHRSLVLEGVRRAALRNIGSPNGEESQSIVDAGAVRLFSRKYNESVEVIEEDLNRICGDMFAIFMNSLWDVYLCLLYEELQAYRRLVKRNSGFGYAPLSAFMDANGDLLAHLREFRDRVLHPESRTSTSNALDGLLSSLDRKDQPFPKFVTEAQFLVDAHTVRFWHSMGSYFIREGDLSTTLRHPGFDLVSRPSGVRRSGWVDPDCLGKRAGFRDTSYEAFGAIGPGGFEDARRSARTAWARP